MKSLRKSKITDRQSNGIPDFFFKKMILKISDDKKVRKITR